MFLSCAVTLQQLPAAFLISKNIRSSICRRSGKYRLCVKAEKDGEGVVNEDILAKLKAAEEEAQKLKQELAEAKLKAGVVTGADSNDTKPARRIDSGDLRRETLFSESKQRTNWLNESDVNFFTGGGPTELGEDGAVSSEEQKGIVMRRLVIGLGLTVALGAFALVPTEKLSPPPSKPLFFYLVPLLRVQELLKLAEAAAPEGDYGQLKSITARILGSPNNLQENLRSAAASLPDSRAVSTAEALGREVYECVEQIDFNRYFDTMGAPGSMGGKVEKQLFDFSQQSAKAAQVKLREFLALMPREQLEAAQQQVNSSPF